MLWAIHVSCHNQNRTSLQQLRHPVVVAVSSQVAGDSLLIVSVTWVVQWLWWYFSVYIFSVEAISHTMYKFRVEFDHVTLGAVVTSISILWLIHDIHDLDGLCYVVMETIGIFYHCMTISILVVIWSIVASESKHHRQFALPEVPGQKCITISEYRWCSRLSTGWWLSTFSLVRSWSICIESMEFRVDCLPLLCTLTYMIMLPLSRVDGKVGCKPKPVPPTSQLYALLMFRTTWSTTKFSCIKSIQFCERELRAVWAFWGCILHFYRAQRTTCYICTRNFMWEKRGMWSSCKRWSPSSSSLLWKLTYSSSTTQRILMLVLQIIAYATMAMGNCDHMYLSVL